MTVKFKKKQPVEAITYDAFVEMITSNTPEPHICFEYKGVGFTWDYYRNFWFFWDAKSDIFFFRQGDILFFDMDKPRVMNQNDFFDEYEPVE